MTTTIIEATDFFIKAAPPPNPNMFLGAGRCTYIYIQQIKAMNGSVNIPYTVHIQ